MTTDGPTADPVELGWLLNYSPYHHVEPVAYPATMFAVFDGDTGRRRAFLGAAADDVFGRFADRVPPFGAAAANAYADIIVEREQAGEPIAGFDAQIAAICRVHRAALATRNTSDFTRLGLDFVDPWLTGT